MNVANSVRPTIHPSEIQIFNGHAKYAFGGINITLIHAAL